jgi:hypothetical protein
MYVVPYVQNPLRIIPSHDYVINVHFVSYNNTDTLYKFILPNVPLRIHLCGHVCHLLVQRFGQLLLTEGPDTRVEDFVNLLERLPDAFVEEEKDMDERDNAENAEDHIKLSQNTNKQGIHLPGKGLRQKTLTLH